MIRAFLINNLLSTSKKTKKTLRLFSEIGIFLIIAALVSSGISIYYENKLRKLNTELILLELEEFTIQEWLSDAPGRNLDYKKGKFLYETIKGNEIYNISKNRFYFYLLGWYPQTIKYATDDIGKIDNEYLKKKYKIKDIIKSNYEISSFYNTTFDKFPQDDDEFLEQSEILERENILKKVSLDKIQKYLKQSELNTLQINLFFQEYNEIVDTKKNLLKKDIIEITENSTNAILYAFIFQLIIFSLVQVFELREIS